MPPLRTLGPSDQASASAFCAAHSSHCTYIAGWLHEGGLQRNSLVPHAWLFAETRGAEIIGLAYISTTGIAIPSVGTSAALDQLADMARANPNTIRVIVGDRAQVAELWGRLEGRGMRARIARDQLGYAVTREELVIPQTAIELELATLVDLDRVVSASAAMAREEAHDDPQARNPELFRSRIAERLARGRDFIYRSGPELVFKTNIAALSPIGGQVEGIYTPPAHRGRGIGLRGTAAITMWVLERAQRAALLVNEDNAVARRLYEALGYQRTVESRTIFIAP